MENCVRTSGYPGWALPMAGGVLFRHSYGVVAHFGVCFVGLHIRPDRHKSYNKRDASAPRCTANRSSAMSEKHLERHV
jgi:hypothetical protein